MIRAFIAATLAESVIEEIAKIRSRFQEIRADIRWTREEGLHVTLKFLGEIDRAQVEPVLTAMRQTVADRAPFCVTAQGVEAFPHLRRPRVLWVGLHGGELAALRADVEAALMPLDFPPEDRDFSPHVTFGRVRSPRGWEQLAPLVKAHQQTIFGESSIRQISLYRSELRPDGARYTALGTATFRPEP